MKWKLIQASSEVEENLNCDNEIQITPGGIKKNPCLLQIRGKGSSRRNGGNGFRAIYISFLSLADPNGFLGEGNQKGLSPSHKAISNTCTPSSSQTTSMLYNFLTLQIFGSAEIAPNEINLGLHLQF